MYIDSISLERFRTFRKCRIDFLHPDHEFDKLGLPTPRFPNVNLLLGNNGLGKTTLLKAIALAALGPAVADSGIYAHRLVRREPETVKCRKKISSEPSEALIEARFTLHEQDHTKLYEKVESRVTVARKGDLAQLRWTHSDEKPWHPIYSSSSDAFFFVGYGATRRVERKDRLDPAARQSSAFVRAQRVQSLFEEAYSLIPMNVWLPQFKQTTRAATRPNIQFIVTSHSPLIVGSLEWMNIILMAPAPRQASEPKRLEWAVHGPDADQILLTDFFGLESTRVEGKKRALKALTLTAVCICMKRRFLGSLSPCGRGTE